MALELNRRDIKAIAVSFGDGTVLLMKPEQDSFIEGTLRHWAEPGRDDEGSYHRWELHWMERSKENATSG